MKYIKEYLIYCGVLVIINTISLYIQHKEIIAGNIYKLIFPGIMVAVFYLINKFNKADLNSKNKSS